MPEPSLVDVKIDWMQRISSLEEAFLNRGVILVDTLEVDANKSTVEWLAVIEANAPTTVERSSEMRFILADNTVVNITYEQLDAIKKAVNKYLLDVHIEKQTLRGQVEAATNIEELPSISVDSLGSLVENFVRLKD